MLKVIFAILFLALLIKTAHYNVYLSFSIFLFVYVSLMIIISEHVDYDDILEERRLLRTPEGRRKYYHIINSR